jgi:hypothetical protein
MCGFSQQAKNISVMNEDAMDDENDNVSKIRSTVFREEE